MSAQIVLQTPAVTLYYHPIEKIVHHEVHAFLAGQEFRNVLEKGFELLKQHGAHRWLSDDRKNGAIPKADGEWADQVWLPKVVAAGWNTWAMVHPEMVVGQLNSRRFTDGFAAKGLKVKVFASPTEAFDWLKKA